MTVVLPMPDGGGDIVCVMVKLPTTTTLPPAVHAPQDWLLAREKLSP